MVISELNTWFKFKVLHVMVAHVLFNSINKIKNFESKKYFDSLNIKK